MLMFDRLLTADIVRSSIRTLLLRHFKRLVLRICFLGKELGGRPRDGCCYEDGCVNFRRLAEREEFKRGIERLLEMRSKYSIALMCAEKDPLQCHRTILIARAIKNTISTSDTFWQTATSRNILKLNAD